MYQTPLPIPVEYRGGVTASKGQNGAGRSALFYPLTRHRRVAIVSALKERRGAAYVHDSQAFSKQFLMHRRPRGTCPTLSSSQSSCDLRGAAISCPQQARILTKIYTAH